MRYPAIATIEASLNVDAPTAMRIHAALVTCKNVGQVLMALGKVEAILDGHSVEYIRSAQDTIHDVLGVEYVNMGDTYAATVLFDYAKGAFLVGAWGDIVEQLPSRFTE